MTENDFSYVKSTLFNKPYTFHCSKQDILYRLGGTFSGPQILKPLVILSVKLYQTLFIEEVSFFIL